MSVDELMPDARELIKDRKLPTRNALRKSLNIRWDQAERVFQSLALELSRDSAQRRAKRAKVALRNRVRALPSGRPARREVHVLNVPAVPQQIVVDQAGNTPDAEPVIVSVKPRRKAATWPVVLLAMPAFVAIWSGWVDLGRLTGFGVVHPLPGIADEVALNTAITLPVGLETYAAYALYVWLSGRVPARARQFARRSAIGSLVLGAGGQVAYHLMVAAGMDRAPWWITTVVACLPVAVLGMGAALRHLVHAEEKES